jgi:hypothetical protein
MHAEVDRTEIGIACFDNNSAACGSSVIACFAWL